MTDTADTATVRAWIVILATLATLAIVAVRNAPRAHCHGGDCHVHAAGVR